MADENLNPVNPAGNENHVETTPELGREEVGAPKPTKTFTQEDVDNIVVTRLGKERAKLMKKLGIEDESELEELLRIKEEYPTLKEQNEAFLQKEEERKYAGILKELNVDEDFIEFVMTKVEKGEQFEEKAKAFLEANPKMLKENYKPLNSGLGLNGTNSTPDLSKMSTEEYLAWRSKNKF